MIYFIDLFAGAGGTTTGLSKVEGIKVVACINHDPNSIKSHAENHPDCLHFVEDIRTIDLHPILDVIKAIRKKDKKAIIAIWASIECTEFSKAKGGLSRKADSRTLANDLFRYLDVFDPDMLFIENVREFMSWGPLDEKGKPISMKNGLDYQRWIANTKRYGYEFDYRIMNSADYGAYTRRERYFAQFVKPKYKIAWPHPTHSKKVHVTDLFSNTLKPWKAVKDVLELDQHGVSIFGRRKKNGEVNNLSDKTYMRIYMGLIKFVAGGKEQFLLKYNSVNFETGKYVPPSLEDPSPTLSTQSRLNIISTQFISKQFSGRPYDKNISLEVPCGTVKKKDSHVFITTYHGNGNNLHDIENPSPTATSKDTIALVNTQFIKRDFSNGVVTDIDNPAGTVMPSPKMDLMTAEMFLMNPQYTSAGGSVDDPSFTLIARMDKMPPYLVVTEQGNVGIKIEEGDTEHMIKIKEFMAMYGIVDIKIRMLFIKELQRIQGFPEEYVFHGNAQEQKKQIGNAVEVNQAKVIGQAVLDNNLK